MSIIGLDLGNTSFRALELDRKKDGIIVEKAGVYENSKLNFDSDAKEDIDAYANALKDFFCRVRLYYSFCFGGFGRALYLHAYYKTASNER